MRPAFRDRFVIDAKFVCDRLAGFVIEQTVNLLKMRIGDFRSVLAYFYFGNDFSVFRFHGSQLVNAAEYRLAFGSDQTLANTENIDGGAPA